MAGNSKVGKLIMMKISLFILFNIFWFAVESQSQSSGYVLWNSDGTVRVPANTITISQINALQSSLDLKANLASPTFTGTVSGITATMVGLGNVTNESKSTMFTSPTFTGTVTYPSSQTFTTPSFTTGFTIGGVAATGKFIVGNGTNYVASTSTIPTSAGATANKLLLSDGTNYVLSTPTFPNASATSGKVIKSDGTNWTASTETYAAPSTSGNLLMSDGTNWTSAATRGNYTSFVVSGSNATTTGQTLVDVTGLVSGTLSNSTTYEVEAMLYVTTTAVTTGTQYGIGAGGSGGAAVVEVLVMGTTTVNATTAVTENAASTAQGTFLTTSASSGIIWIKGIVTTRGSGTANISIQHLKVTSGTSTVNVGSWMKIRQLN